MKLIEEIQERKIKEKKNKLEELREKLRKEREAKKLEKKNTKKELKEEIKTNEINHHVSNRYEPKEDDQVTNFLISLLV